jgi:voltage-gated potassium channel
MAPRATRAARGARDGRDGRDAWDGRDGLLPRFRLPLCLVAAAVVYGTVGYVLIEGIGVLDALYQTFLVLSTIGTGTPEPRGDGAKLFTISLILFGVAVVFAGIGVGTQVLVSGELAHWARRRRMTGRLARLSDHFIVCAYGRVGRTVADELREQGCTIVVIESKPELAAVLAERGDLHLLGDPSDERVLYEAGIDRARALVCAVDSDATNIYITLTAKALNPSLRIIARASAPGTGDKLIRAGADEVISPYQLSGRRMALLALRPSMVEMLDLLGFGPDFRLEEVLVRPGARLDGLTIGETLTRYAGVSILAIKQPDTELTPAPDHALRLRPGDLVLGIGPNAMIDRMSE